MGKILSNCNELLTTGGWLFVVGTSYVIELVMGGRLLSYDSALARFIEGTGHPDMGLFLGLAAGFFVVDLLNARRIRHTQPNRGHP